MSQDYDKMVRQMAMDRFAGVYLALHGWKAFDGVVLLLWEGERTNAHDAQLALRYRHPRPIASLAAATVPALWGTCNMHLHPVSRAEAAPTQAS